MNRWAVVEFLRIRFIRTGTIPPLEEVAQQFPGLDRLELCAGVEEFCGYLSWRPGDRR